mmetsp:Transcript_13409/g.11447  ORF Transcript_13409/g.11447 Transcript_13409/m.11447 type:complete len:120 (+) Transcript_13409:28-387(+)
MYSLAVLMCFRVPLCEALPNTRVKATIGRRLAANQALVSQDLETAHSIVPTSLVATRWSTPMEASKEDLYGLSMTMISLFHLPQKGSSRQSDDDVVDCVVALTVCYVRLGCIPSLILLV